MLLFLKKENKKKVIEWKDKIQKIKKENKIDKQQNKQKQQQHNSLCLHDRWRCYLAIVLNDQQVGPTSLSLPSP